MKYGNYLLEFKKGMMFNIEKDIQEMICDAKHDQKKDREECLPTDKSIDLLKKIMDVVNKTVIDCDFPHAIFSNGDGSTECIMHNLKEPDIRISFQVSFDGKHIRGLVLKQNHIKKHYGTFYNLSFVRKLCKRLNY